MDTPIRARRQTREGIAACARHGWPKKRKSWYRAGCSATAKATWPTIKARSTPTRWAVQSHRRIGAEAREHAQPGRQDQHDREHAEPETPSVDPSSSANDR